MVWSLFYIIVLRCLREITIAATTENASHSGITIGQIFSTLYSAKLRGISPPAKIPRSIQIKPRNIRSIKLSQSAQFKYPAINAVSTKATVKLTIVEIANLKGKRIISPDT